MSAPRIETPRLLLRAYAVDEFDACAGLWADATVTRFIGGRPLTREEAWVRMLRYAGLWSLLGYGFWAVVERESGRIVGEAGFHDMMRDITPAIAGTPEAGWALRSHAHGRGYATEVITAIHEWSDRSLSAPSTVCLIDPENHASLRVAERAGYAVEAATTYHGASTLLLRRPKRGRAPAPG